MLINVYLSLEIIISSTSQIDAAVGEQLVRGGSGEQLVFMDVAQAVTFGLIDKILDKRTRDDVDDEDEKTSTKSEGLACWLEK